MRARYVILVAAVAIATIAGGIAPTFGQQPPPRQGAGRLQLEPLGNKEEAVFPYFEGWYTNEDGTATIMLGYYNRNTEQTLEVPIGPNNRMEPGGPDRGQPTVFLPRRQWGVFSITVPKDFGTQKITWTLTANNLTNAVTVWLNPKYFVEPFKNIANGNTPAQMRFSPSGPILQGPPKAIAQTLQATVNQPLSLEVWAADRPATYDAATNTFLSLEEVAAKQVKDQAEREAGRGAGRGGTGATGATGAAGATAGREARGGDAPIAIINGQVIGAAGRSAGSAASTRAGAGVPAGPPADVTIVWSKYRGPGEVTFEKARVPVQLNGKFTEFTKAVTTATFSAPGEYWLRAVANDSSGDGGGGDQCCWTTAHVKVTVK
jgi:hypothetical protein